MDNKNPLAHRGTRGVPVVPPCLALCSKIGDIGSLICRNVLGNRRDVPYGQLTTESVGTGSAQGTIPTAPVRP